MWVTEPPPWKITLPVPLLLFVVLWSRSSARKQTNKQTKNVNLCGTKWVGAYQLVRRGNVEAEEEKVKAKSCNNTHIRKDRHLVKEQKKGMRPRKTILQAEKKKMMRLSLTTLCKGQREARRKEEQKKKKLNSTFECSNMRRKGVFQMENTQKREAMWQWKWITFFSGCVTRSNCQHICWNNGKHTYEREAKTKGEKKREVRKRKGCEGKKKH